MPDGYGLELFKAGLNLSIAAIGFVATWGIGKKLTERWNLRQKRRELNLESVRLFHELYGELKELVKTWRLARQLHSHDSEDDRWQLLLQACAMESKVEALVLRLATERSLEPDDCTAIGLFRQAAQTVRESIRDNADCPLADRGPEYRLLNEVAPKVAVIVSQETRQVPAEEAVERLAAMAGITKFSWRREILRRTGAKAGRDKPQAARPATGAPLGAS